MMFFFPILHLHKTLTHTRNTISFFVSLLSLISLRRVYISPYAVPSCSFSYYYHSFSLYLDIYINYGLFVKPCVRFNHHLDSILILNIKEVVEIRHLKLFLSASRTVWVLGANGIYFFVCANQLCS